MAMPLRGARRCRLLLIRWSLIRPSAIGFFSAFSLEDIDFDSPASRAFFAMLTPRRTQRRVQCALRTMAFDIFRPPFYALPFKPAARFRHAFRQIRLFCCCRCLIAVTPLRLVFRHYYCLLRHFSSLHTSPPPSRFQLISVVIAADAHAAAADCAFRLPRQLIFLFADGLR